MLWNLHFFGRGLGVFCEFRTKRYFCSRHFLLPCFVPKYAIVSFQVDDGVREFQSSKLFI
jgi:hypothetical protein